MLGPLLKGPARVFVRSSSGFLIAVILVAVSTFGGPSLKGSTEEEGILLISRSSTSVAGGGKATLTIGPLRPQGDIYSADYQVKVSPYFFKSEKGKLAIIISRESLENAGKGMPVEITGTATTSGESQPRQINATAIPRTKDEGSLKVWFMSGGKKTVFNTSYRLVRRDSLQASRN
jgi:hypothetical protein